MSERVSIAVFSWWGEVPDHLKTKEQLKQMKLLPTGDIQARVVYGHGRRARSYDLYDQSQTRSLPHRTDTPKILASRERAQVARSEARRTCCRCHAVVSSPAMLDANGICTRCEQE